MQVIGLKSKIFKNFFFPSPFVVVACFGIASVLASESQKFLRTDRFDWSHQEDITLINIIAYMKSLVKVISRCYRASKKFG